MLGAEPGLAVAVLVIALVLIAVFVWWELRSKTPALNLRVLFSNRLWPVYLTSFLFGIVLFGTQSITTTFLAGQPDTLGYGFGFSAGQISLVTGLNMLLAAAGAILYSSIAAKITLKGVLILGAISVAVGQVMLIVGHLAFPVVLVSIALSGLGGGLLLGGLPAATTEASPDDETGIATGVYNSVKTLGGAIAGAVFASTLGLFLIPEAGASSIGGYITVWVICAVATGICPIFLAMMRSHRTAV